MAVSCGEQDDEGEEEEEKEVDEEGEAWPGLCSLFGRFQPQLRYQFADALNWREVTAKCSLELCLGMVSVGKDS